MLASELRSCDCHWSPGFAWYISAMAHDWWTRRLGDNADAELPQIGAKLNGIHQAFLQKHLGSLLLGVWTLYSHLTL